MAELRCANCGKENPESLSVCQFCQSPLVPESRLQLGDKPTKRKTGELEPALPDWLKDMRQQARDSAEEEAAQSASMPKIQKDEPPDLLAGLAFQASDAEEDVPDWLASLTPKKDEKKPSSTAQPEPDFFAQFNQSEPAPKSEPEPAEFPQEPSPVPGTPPDAAQQDELSDWFAKAADEPARPFELESDDPSSWDLSEQLSPRHETSTPPQEAEDLSWLRDLESDAKKTGELSSPKRNEEWAFDPGAPSQSSGQEDLSWLDQLGSVPASFEPDQKPDQPHEDLSWLNQLGSVPAPEEPTPSPSQPKEDLSWLNDFTEPSSPAKPEPAPSASQEDLSWLNDLGSSPGPGEAVQPSQDLSWLQDLEQPAASDEPAIPPAQPGEVPDWLSAFAETQGSSEPQSAPPSAQDDPGWLDSLDAAPQSSQPFSIQEPGPTAQEDLSWLNDLKGSAEPFPSEPVEAPGEAQPPATELPHISPFSPRQTAPLDENADPNIPDWLKSASEGPSLPLGAEALDQFREDYKIPSQPEEPFSWKNFVQGIEPAEEPSAEEQPAPAEEPATLSNQDVDSLFSVNMPDWLSRPEPAEDKPAAEEIGIHAEGGEALSPVDLPSWVQAMRPVEAVISEAGPTAADQPAEREGPLAGFRGIIPVAPIGSSRRPQPIPLKLQASDEQQASAAILEQILLGETTPRPLVSSPEVISQRMLRWVIAGLMLIVLGTVVLLRTQVMPVPAPLPSDADITNVVMNISSDAPVLVILDYEPALAGEMEASSGPLLDQLVQLRHPHLSFVTTSPSGAALVERLLVNTNISRPEGYGYIAGQNYANMGYLPGGQSGVLAFIQSPQVAIPSSPVLQFSEYAAVLLLTDHAESARVWVEQLQTWKELDPALASQPLLAVTSAQAGPMLQPYASSRQITGLISGLADAARYETASNRPGIARSYWDTFGAGVMLAVGLIVLGSLWSLFSGMRTRRMEAVEE